MIALADWRCENRVAGVVCGRTLLAYDPGQVTLAQLKGTQQVKCQRCRATNGIAANQAYRVEARR